MKKILISACLLGQPVRYNGKSLAIEHPLVQKWQKQGRLVAVCPEMEGGLPVPRPPAELFDGQADDAVEGTAEVITVNYSPL